MRAASECVCVAQSLRHVWLRRPLCDSRRRSDGTASSENRPRAPCESWNHLPGSLGVSGVSRFPFARSLLRDTCPSSTPSPTPTPETS